METYNIIDLLIFFKTQQQNEYRGIETIIEIMEDQRIPPEEKIPIAVSLLLLMELEEDYTIEPMDDDIPMELPEPEKPIKRFNPYRVDKFWIPILDCVIPYDAILN